MGSDGTEDEWKNSAETSPTPFSPTKLNPARVLSYRAAGAVRRGGVDSDGEEVADS